VALGAVLVLYGVVSLVGITWGLPSRKIDKYLFGDGEVWSGEKIYRLAKAEAKFDPARGADVDVDPLNKGGDEPIPLTATEEDVAKIYLRYRLYTYQPDEMITMMALAGMRPSRLELDPRLYQYGGLFIYPAGALIKLCGLLGLIDVRSDVVFYLDHPDEFGKFYVVARAYSAAWGLIGVIVVYAIARRLAAIRTPSASAGSTGDTLGAAGDPDRPVARAPGSDSAPPADGGASNRPLPRGRGSEQAHRAGLLAALLFTLMPVVVCMSHEGKPHLPGAVLMLLAVYFAMRCVPWGTTEIEDQRSKIEEKTIESETGNGQSTIDTCPEPRRNRQFFWWMCVCCGAALGMVLSSWPIFVLIPLVAVRAAGGKKSRRAGSPRGESDAALVLTRRRRFVPAFHRTLLGLALALGVYLLTNPYILINAFVNREVLRSNFGNSLAMYQIARIGEGFVRVVELTLEGATLPMVVVGLVGLFIAVVRRHQAAVPLVVVAGVFLLQFVLIGAGKPAEYGRFGIFTNTVLAVAAGCLLGGRKPRVIRWAGLPAAVAVTAWIAWSGYAYLNGFIMDAGDQGSRLNLARFCRYLSREAPTTRITTPLATFAEPAPYCYPPIDFAHADLRLVSTTSYLGFGADRDAFAFSPVENAEWMFPKYAETPAFAPILRTARFVDDPSWSTMMLRLDSTWRTALGDFDQFGYRWRRSIARHETSISWANKPFFDSVLHYLTSRQVVPPGR